MLLHWSLTPAARMTAFGRGNISADFHGREGRFAACPPVRGQCFAVVRVSACDWLGRAVYFYRIVSEDRTRNSRERTLCSIEAGEASYWHRRCLVCRMTEKQTIGLYAVPVSVQNFTWTVLLPGIAPGWHHSGPGRSQNSVSKTPATGRTFTNICGCQVSNNYPNFPYALRKVL